ncbi:hypothetical protein GCM10027342_43310 [Photobacterium alginatilyticum]
MHHHSIIPNTKPLAAMKPIETHYIVPQSTLQHHISTLNALDVPHTHIIDLDQLDLKQCDMKITWCR